MRFKIYGENNDILKKPLLITEDSFNLVSNTDNIIYRSIKAINNNYDFYIDIDDKMHNLNDYFSIEIVIRKVFKLYFVFDNGEQEEEIQSAVLSIKDMPTKTDKEKEEKVKKLLSIMKEYHPFLVFSDQYLPYLDETIFDKSTLVFMRKDPEEIEEKKAVEKNNFLIDALFLIFMPALTLAFLFITMDFFNKNNSGLGILLIFISLLEVGIFAYSLILINREEKNKKLFSKYHIVLYLINIVGLLIGFGLVILLGNTLLKTGEMPFIMQLAWISLGGAFAVSFILNIAMYYLNRWLVKRKNNKKSKVNI